MGLLSSANICAARFSRPVRTALPCMCSQSGAGARHRTRLKTLCYRSCQAADVSGYQFRDLRKRVINEARERGDATAFAGHKNPRTTHRNYFTEAAKVKPLR